MGRNRELESLAPLSHIRVGQAANGLAANLDVIAHRQQPTTRRGSGQQHVSRLEGENLRSVAHQLRHREDQVRRIPLLTRSPLSHISSDRQAGSRSVTMAGPRGWKVSKPFPLSQGPEAGSRSLAVMSMARV